MHTHKCAPMLSNFQVVGLVMHHRGLDKTYVEWYIASRQSFELALLCSRIIHAFTTNLASPETSLGLIRSTWPAFKAYKSRVLRCLMVGQK